MVRAGESLLGCSVREINEMFALQILSPLEPYMSVGYL